MVLLPVIYMALIAVTAWLVVLHLRNDIWIFEGERVGVLAFGLAAAFLMVVPFLDRPSTRGERSPVFTIAAVLGLVYLVVFTIVGRLAK